MLRPLSFLAILLISSFIAYGITFNTSTPLSIEQKQDQLTINEENSVLSAKTSRIRISGENQDFSNTGGLIAQATTDEPVVEIEGFGVSGEVTVDIYRADENALLDYLLHDQENKQIKKTPDISKFSLLTSTRHTLGTKLSLPEKEAGTWFLRVKKNENQVDSFVIRSNTGVLAKEGDNEFIFWGQDFKTRRSISEGTVKIFSLENTRRELSQANFASDGIAKVPIPKEADIAVVERGLDRAIVPLNLRYLNIGYNYRSFIPKSSKVRYFVFTDRPLYRPGDKVYFKSVLRDDDDVRYAIPSGEALVKIYRNWDEKNTIFEKNYAISGSGSIDGEFVLAEDATPGYYALKVQIPNSAAANQLYDWEDYISNTISFQVEFFKKPEYSLDIQTPKRELIAGDASSFKITGSYFSGHPLKGQKVSYKIFASDDYEYEYWNDFQTNLSDDYRYGWWWDTQAVVYENVTLNEKGEVEVVLPTKFNKLKNQVVTIEAEINDSPQSPTFARKNILVYAADFGIFRKNYSSASQVGKEANLNLILAAHRDASVANVPLKSKIKRESWVENKKEVEEFAPISSRTDDKGEATLTFTPAKPGLYLVTVEAQDKKNNTFAKTFYLWASSEDQPYFSETNNDLVVMKDKAKYKPNETMQLSIYSTLPGRDIFLSLERARVNRYQIVHLQGKSAQLEIPLVETDAPNIYLQLSSFSESNLDTTGSINIPVSTDNKKILVRVTPDQDKYKPADTARLNLETTDMTGKPVSAETTLFVIDKALFELVSEQRKNIFEAFWQERSDQTSQAHSLEGILSYPEGGRGGGGGGEARSVFKDTAYWNPKIVTNASGRASVSFKLPDNLTTWVVTAIATTSDTKAGETKNEIWVTKDIVVRPVMPNILRVDDKIVLTASVQNFTDLDQIFDIELKFDSGEVKRPLYSGTLIRAKNISEYNWEIIPRQEDNKAKLVFSAKGVNNKKLRDTVTQEIPVRIYGFQEKRAQFGDGQTVFGVKLAKNINSEKSKITLSLSPTLLGSLPSAVSYLLDYPYGCVEQTTSRLVPLIIAKTNPDIFGKYLEGKNIDAMIKKGIERLQSLQQSDGGWAWWSYGNSDPFVTAYVVEYLTIAKAAGTKVNEELLANAQRYLMQNNYYSYDKKTDVTYSRDEIVAKTYALSFLKAEKGKTRITDFTNIAADVLSMVVITNYQNGIREPEQNGLNLLLGQARTQGDGIFWEAGANERFGSKDAATALAVRAILTAAGDREQAVRAVRYLTRNRKYDYWSNTFATVQVMRAIVDLSKTEEELTPSYKYEIFLDGQEFAAGEVTDAKTPINNLSIPLKRIKPQGSKIIVNKEGAGQLYSTLLIDELHTDRQAKAQNQGLSIKREYVNEKGANYQLGVGDIVLVRLTVSGLEANQNYGVIEDELPSGLMPVNLRFKNEQASLDKGPYYNAYGWTNQEITENGVVLSAYTLTAGQQVFTYKARVVAAGEFIVPPAYASLMYNPEFSGRTEAQSIKTVKAAGQYSQPLISLPNTQYFEKQYSQYKNEILTTVILLVLVIIIVIFFKLKREGKV